MTALKQNISDLNKHIQSLHLPLSPDILVASKYANTEQIHALYQAGFRLFGENKIQDGIAKIKALSDLNIQWHFIGHLQRNKVKLAVHYFDCIDSVDSIRLCEKINQVAKDLKKIIPICLQINVAKEPQKHGFFPADFLTQIETIQTFEHCLPIGLMVMLPYSSDEPLLSRYCQQASALFRQAQSSFQNMTTLSMGMSHDYPIALQHGATLIRIGRLLFNKKEL